MHYIPFQMTLTLKKENRSFFHVFINIERDMTSTSSSNQDSMSRIFLHGFELFKKFMTKASPVAYWRQNTLMHYMTSSILF